MNLYLFKSVFSPSRIAILAKSVPSAMVVFNGHAEEKGLKLDEWKLVEICEKEKNEVFTIVS